MNTSPSQRLLPNLALVAAIAACASTDGDEAAPARELSRAEARIESLNLARREGYGLVRAPELERYLNKQADKILQVAGRPDLDVEVRVAAALVFNASAHPGDFIRVSVGMLEGIKSEDELVFWLAHEVAHLVEGHHDKSMLFDWQEQAVARLGFLNAAEIMGRSLKSGLAEEHYSGGSELDEWHKQAARVAFLSTAIIAPSWTREQEKEADFRAFDWMTQMGHRPDRALCAMDRLRSWEGTHGVRYFKTLELMTTEYAEGALKRARDHLIGQQYGDVAFAAVSDGIASFKVWITQTASELSSEHLGAGVRYRDLQAYWREQDSSSETGPGAGPGPGPGPTGAASAGPVDPCGPEDDGWMRLARGRTTQQILSNYIKARDALIANTEGDTDAAARIAEGMLSGVTVNHALPRLVMAEIRAAQQREERQRDNLTRAFDASEPALRPYLALADFQEQQDEVADALRTAKEGFTRFDDAPEVLPHLIRLNAKVGNGSEAKRLLLECQLNHAAYLDLCQEAAAEGLNAMPHESGSAAQMLAAMKGIDEDAARAELAARAQQERAATGAPTPTQPASAEQGGIEDLACSAQEAVGGMVSSFKSLFGGSSSQQSGAQEPGC